jgi:NADPH:quinone reductase-like Zn-dependent oxidoreductase
VDLSASDLIAAYRDAAGGGVDVVIDNVNGAPGEAALEVLALNGRLIHVGAMAGPTMTVRGGALRRMSADIRGFAYYHAPVDLQAQAYGELCRLAAAGEIEIDVETHPLSQIGTAWDARAAGNRRRQVLIP